MTTTGVFNFRMNTILFLLIFGTVIHQVSGVKSILTDNRPSCWELSARRAIVEAISTDYVNSVYAERTPVFIPMAQFATKLAAANLYESRHEALSQLSRSDKERINIHYDVLSIRSAGKPVANYSHIIFSSVPYKGYFLFDIVQADDVQIYLSQRPGLEFDTVLVVCRNNEIDHVFVQKWAR